MKVFYITLSLIILSTICTNNQVPELKASITRQIMDRFLNAEPKELFKVFHYVFNKSYSLNSETGLQKYRVFKQNVKEIKEFNARGLSWWKGVQEHSDLTKEEFKKHYNLKPRSAQDFKALFGNRNFLSDEINFDLLADKEEVQKENATGASYNWMNTLGAARDQGNCGSCWAFSTMAGIESQLYISNSKYKLQYLSTQQLVDCDTNDGGCNGGWMPSALAYLNSAGGAMLDSSYPYTSGTSGNSGTCAFVNSKVVAQVANMNGCDPGWSFSQTCTLTNWLNFMSTGALSVVVSAGDILENYSGGIIDLSTMGTSICSQFDHAVLAVGYTTNSAGRGIITVRNSWSTGWGQNGYFQIYYTTSLNSTCWITNVAVQPVL